MDWRGTQQELLATIPRSWENSASGRVGGWLHRDSMPVSAINVNKAETFFTQVKSSDVSHKGSLNGAYFILRLRIIET